MSYSMDDLLTGMQGSRSHFLKHLEGLRDDQWDWKPNTECKSIRETLAHLVNDDRAARDSLATGADPDFEKYNEAERDLDRLKAMLSESYEELLCVIRERFAECPLDMTVNLWGTSAKLGSALAYMTSEDFYHAGQVAYIRLATDPAWDYYGAIYGPE